MQDHPRAPGNARQGTLGTDGPAACGGAAAQSPAPGPTRPRATPMPTPMPMPPAPDHNRSRATSMLPALDHSRSRATPMPMPNVPDHADRGPARAGPSVPLPTIPWPAGVRRLLPEVLHRAAATPCTRPFPQSPAPLRQSAQRRPTCPPPGYRAPPPILGILPAKCRPAHRPPPTTAGTGYPRHRHSRAPPRSAPPENRPFSAMVPRSVGDVDCGLRSNEEGEADSPSVSLDDGEVTGQSRTTPGTIRAALACQRAGG